ncbi:MAG: hypothetical protein ABI810_15660 [Sphingomonas bacterium]
MKIGAWLAAGLVFAGCSPKISAAERYNDLLQCEMRVLVVAKFHPSLKDNERASMNEKLASLSQSVLASAASLGKTSAEIGADQQRMLKNLQGRVVGPSANSEADKIGDEAKSCK